MKIDGKKLAQLIEHAAKTRGCGAELQLGRAHGLDVVVTIDNFYDTEQPSCMAPASAIDDVLAHGFDYAFNSVEYKRSLSYRNGVHHLRHLVDLGREFVRVRGQECMKKEYSDKYQAAAYEIIKRDFESFGTDDLQPTIEAMRNWSMLAIAKASVDPQATDVVRAAAATFNPKHAWLDGYNEGLRRMQYNSLGIGDTECGVFNEGVLEALADVEAFKDAIGTAPAVKVAMYLRECS